MDETQGILGSNIDWANKTTVHPFGLLMVLACGVAMLMLNRRHAIWPMIVIACFVAPAQRLVIMGLDFNFLRLMVLFGFARILLWGEMHEFRWSSIDVMLVLWVVAFTVAGTVLEGSFAALINRLGSAFDAVGMYFMFRCWIRTWEDLDSVVLGFILASIPICIAFLIESHTGRNTFAVFGGVPEITVIREGKLRCQGAFAHAILAGCFWASLMPLFAARYWRGGRDWFWGVVGLAASSLIIVFCASSTPLMGVMFALLGAAFFAFRRHMQMVRWALLLALVGLHLVMKAPVWHLISRVDVVSGSTGWHRYQLINEAINHFGEWWLVGTTNITHWGVFANDVTNQYILEGVKGGAVSMALFIVTISLAFAAVGRLWRKAEGSSYRVAVAWALGVSMFVHVMSFFAVSYFGQIWMVWYLTLALIGSLAPAAHMKHTKHTVALRSTRPVLIPENVPAQ